LATLQRRGSVFDAQEPERTRKFLNLEPSTAELLHTLVRATKRRCGLEIGTSNGYSAIWLGMALCDRPDGDGRLVTIERDAAKHAEAVDNIARAGLGCIVDARLGEATQIVATLPGPFDFVFFDADRVCSARQLAILAPALAADCLLLADNALSHADELRAYRACVEQLPGFTSMTLPVGKGLHMAYRGPGGPL